MTRGWMREVTDGGESDRHVSVTYPPWGIYGVLTFRSPCVHLLTGITSNAYLAHYRVHSCLIRVAQLD